MFTQNRCLVHYCRNNALSTFDENGEITDARGYCLDHIPDPGKAKEDIYNYITTHDKIVGIMASGLLFQDFDFSNKKFYGCNFTNCTFVNIHCDNIVMKMCVEDYSIYNNCTFTNSTILFNSSAGSTMSHSLFTSCDLIQNCFNGIKAFQCSFDDSDLYNSRFISASLVDTSFRNCNVKRVHFNNSERTNVSFKLSNTREAIFDEEIDDDEQEKKLGNSLLSGGF